MNKKKSEKATGLARTIPKPPFKPVFETKNNPSEKVKKDESKKQ